MSERKPKWPEHYRYVWPTPRDERRLFDLRHEKLGFVENWLGYIGIRYYPKKESFQVLRTVENWGTYGGDGGSCLQMFDTYWWHRRERYVGDHHFLDPDNAINARSCYRRQYVFSA